MSKEAMKQALDALGYVMSHGAQVQIAKDILTQAIEQAEKQEPVAWVNSLDFDDDDQEIIPAKDKGKLGTSNCDIPLYATPKHDYVIDCPRCGHCCAGRTWVGLTEREVELIDEMIETQLLHAERCDHMANSTMAQKQKAWDLERVELLRKLKEKNGL